MAHRHLAVRVAAPEPEGRVDGDDDVAVPVGRRRMGWWTPPPLRRSRPDLRRHREGARGAQFRMRSDTSLDAGEARGLEVGPD